MLDELELLIERATPEWKVPGPAIAVVAIFYKGGYWPLAA